MKKAPANAGAFFFEDGSGPQLSARPTKHAGPACAVGRPLVSEACQAAGMRCSASSTQKLHPAGITESLKS